MLLCVKGCLGSADLWCLLVGDAGPAFHVLQHFSLLFSPKQTIRELFDMPLEEPSGSSVSSAPEEDEETVASKQTHILEQVTKEWGRLVQCVVAQSTELVQEE